MVSRLRSGSCLVPSDEDFFRDKRIDGLKKDAEVCEAKVVYFWAGG